MPYFMVSNDHITWNVLGSYLNIGKYSNHLHLQSLQNRARALIESSRLKDNWRCNWLSVSSLIKYDSAIMMYKTINDSCPDSLKGRFSTRSQLSTYELRNSLDIDVRRLNSEFSKKSFHYSGAKVWHEIPINIRNSPSIYT